MKTVEVVSLAGMISVLHEIVLLLLRINLGNATSTTSLALTVGEFDPSNPLHMVLAMLDLFVIWYLIVVSIGFAKLLNLPAARVMFIVGLAWLIIRLALIAGTMTWLKAFTSSV